MVSAPAKAESPADRFRKTGNNRRDVHRRPSCLLRDPSRPRAKPFASRPHRWLVDSDPESARRHLTACNTAWAHHVSRDRSTARHVEFAHATASCRTGLVAPFSRQKNFGPETQLVL